MDEKMALIIQGLGDDALTVFIVYSALEFVTVWTMFGALAYGVVWFVKNRDKL